MPNEVPTWGIAAGEPLPGWVSPVAPPPELVAEAEPTPPVVPPPPPPPPPPVPLERPEFQLTDEERGFTKQPGWKPADWAGGKVVKEGYIPPDPATAPVTVYKDPRGIRYYTPESTMWGMGYKTSEEYAKTGARVEHPVAVAPYVAVETPEGSKHITKPEAIALSRLKDERQFDELVNLGIIEKGSKFVPDKIKGWGYIRPDKVRKFRGERLVDEVASKIEPGVDWQLITLTQRIGRVLPDSPVNKYAEGDVLNLSEAIKAGYTSVSDYKGWKVTQAQLDKIKEEQTVRQDALDLLADRGYKGYGDRYRVVDALVSDDKEVFEALGVVFSKQDLDAATKWIDRHWGAHGRFIADKQIPLTPEIQKVLRKVTPWQEGKGETFVDYLQRYRRQISIPSPLAPLAVPVAVSPSLHDDILFWLAVFGTGAALAVKAAVEKDRAPAVPDEVSKVMTAFRSTFGRSPTIEDAVFVSPAGMATAALRVDPKKWSIPGVTIVGKPPDIPGFAGQRIDPQILEVFGTKRVDVPMLETFGTKRVEPAIYLPTPKVTMEDLTGRQAGLISAVAQVAVAETELKRVLPSTKTIPIDWDKILTEAQLARKKEDIKKAFSAIPVFLPRVAPEVALHYRRAYEDYLRKKAILEAARSSYVASLNPTPVRGIISDEGVGLAATFLTSKALGLAEPKMGEELTPYLARVLGSKLSKVAEGATGVASKVLTRAITDGKTATQAATQAITATQAAIQPQVANAVKAMNLTATQTKALTQALTRTLVRTATNTAIATAAATGIMTATMAATATATTTITTTGRIIWPFPRGATDKEKRKAIRDSKGAIAFNMGEVGAKPARKRVWHTIVYPFQSKKDYVTVVGKAPTGATVLVEGENSAYRTAQLLYGESPSRRISMDIGFMDVAITARGRKINLNFTPDPKGLTTGDITVGISKPAPAVTERPPRLSKRGSMRITPMRPKLRR